MQIRILALVVLATNASAAFGQIYKCVDERGVTQYADQPCPGRSSRQVNIQASPPMSGDAAPHTEDLHQADRDFLRRQIKRREAEEAESKAAAADKQRCENLRNQLQIYQQVARISTVDANGQRHYMDDSTRAARISELNGEIARSCP